MILGSTEAEINEETIMGTKFVKTVATKLNISYLKNNLVKQYME